MKKILFILSLLISSVQTECMFRLGKLALGKIGLAAGISTGAVYGGMKKSSCKPISIPKVTDSELIEFSSNELIEFSSNELRDACKKCNLPIFGNNDDNWVDSFAGQVHPQGILTQMHYLVYAADKHAPLGTKVRAKQDIYKKAPCVIEEMLKDKPLLETSNEQLITELSTVIKRDGHWDFWYSYPIEKPTSRRFSHKSIESMKSREELVGYAEFQEISAEKNLNEQISAEIKLKNRKEMFEKELAFWTCFKKGVINKTSVKEDLRSRSRCGSAGGYYGELAERARTKSLID